MAHSLACARHVRFAKTTTGGAISKLHVEKKKPGMKQTEKGGRGRKGENTVALSQSHTITTMMPS